MARWREEARGHPEYAAKLSLLDDKELEDHLPAMTENIFKGLLGEGIPEIEQDGRRHGHQRRLEGYRVVEVLRELQVWRDVLLDRLEELAGNDMSKEEFAEARRLIRNLADRGTNASIEQYDEESQRERDSALTEASELHEQRDRFLMTLSHELRNQISPILLAAQLLKDLRISDPRFQEAVGRIERQARYQSFLIDDLLEINRFRYGKIRLRCDLIDLRQAVQQAFETFEGDFQQKSLKPQIVLLDRPAICFADKTRITQIVINLLSNAIKFTPSGGTVSVSLDREGRSFILKVRDTGAGIRQEILQQIFSTFFQAEAMSSHSAAGLGVGLALAKALVEMHGGTIEARSEGAGKGAEFTVRLPVSADVPLTGGPSVRRCVLLIEDNPDQLAGLSYLLQMRGYEVLEARDGFEALSLVSERKPDACVIDIGLPEMDGYQVARKLREIPQTRDCRLIAVTGYGLGEDQQTFENAGFDHYLPKPTNVDELTRILSQN